MMSLLCKCSVATCNQCNVSSHIHVNPHLLIHSNNNIFTFGISAEFCIQVIYRVLTDAFWKKYQKQKKKRLCTSHTLLLPLNHSINEREFIQKQQKNMHNVKETEERVGNGDRPWGRMVCTIVDNQSKMVLGLLYIFLNKLWPSVIETLIGKG